MKTTGPDLVLHLAAENHVDRSIEGSMAFIASNVTGTFHLLQAVRGHWEQLSAERQAAFRFHHISTDDDHAATGIDPGKNLESALALQGRTHLKAAQAAAACPATLVAYGPKKETLHRSLSYNS